MSSLKRQFYSFSSLCLCVFIFYMKGPYSYDLNALEQTPLSTSSIRTTIAVDTTTTISPNRSSSAVSRQAATVTPDNRNNMTSFLQQNFAPMLTKDQRETILRTLHVLVDGLEADNVSYHMCGGTLLGSYLHHGMIPWDDDIDLCVAFRDVDKLIDVLRKIANKTFDDPNCNRYSFVVPGNQFRLKFFSLNGTAKIENKFRKYEWRAPFIDICLYDEDGETIWDKSMGPAKTNAKRFKKSIVFPLGRRPFEGMALRASHNSLQYLANNYKLDWCFSNSYSHLEELLYNNRQQMVPCYRLWPFYPFVFRRPMSGGQIQETLKINGKPIDRVIVDELGSL